MTALPRCGCLHVRMNDRCERNADQEDLLCTYCRECCKPEFHINVYEEAGGSGDRPLKSEA